MQTISTKFVDIVLAQNAALKEELLIANRVAENAAHFALETHYRNSAMASAIIGAEKASVLVTHDHENMAEKLHLDVRPINDPHQYAIVALECFVNFVRTELVDATYLGEAANNRQHCRMLGATASAASTEAHQRFTVA